MEPEDEAATDGDRAENGVVGELLRWPWSGGPRLTLGGWRAHLGGISPFDPVRFAGDRASTRSVASCPAQRATALRGQIVTVKSCARRR